MTGNNPINLQITGDKPIRLIHEFSETRQPLHINLCASYLRMPPWPFCSRTDVI